MNIKDLLTHTVNEKPSEFSDTFRDLVLDRLQAAVANKKIEIAQSLFPEPTNKEENIEDSEENG